MFGDGLQTRSFTYITDAIVATMQAGILPSAIGEIFNVGSDREANILEVAQLVQNAAQSNSELLFEPHTAVYGANFEDTRRRVPDVDKARRQLNFSASVGLEEGIERTVRWWSTRLSGSDPHL